MASEPEIVITGTGVVSPIGIGSGKEAYWASLLSGRSGVGPLESFDPSALPVSIGAELRDFDPKAYVMPRKSLKVMCREIQTGFSAGAIAMSDAGLESGSVEPDRLGVIFGSEMLYTDPRDMQNAFEACRTDGLFEMDAWGTTGLSKLNPLWMLMYLPNMIACHLGIRYDGRGPNNSITIGDASGLLAVIEAASVIGRGHADVMLAGGVGTRLNLTSIVHRSSDILSHRNETPAQACRPFDKNRDGTVNGEGAGAIVLETRAHAERRGAPIYASVAGWGRSFEAIASGQPLRGTAIAATIVAALRSAKLQPDEISHVNAHGLGTCHDDRAEAQAISQHLSADTPVTALKSYFGNLGAGSSIVELVGSVLAIANDLVPPTLNFETPDPECPVRVIANEPLAAVQRSALALSYSGTGQAASVALRKCE
jgi:3-oxoacyl-[acyl-carrier-protein] synthase II